MIQFCCRRAATASLRPSSAPRLSASLRSSIGTASRLCGCAATDNGSIRSRLTDCNRAMRFTLYGDANFFLRGVDRVGPEIPVIPEVEFSASSTYVVIAQRDAVGRKLEELELARKHGLAVIEVRRNCLVLPLTRELTLERGDVLSVVGPRARIDGLTELLGPVEANVVETDMSTFTFGVALGAAIGLLTIDIAGAPIGLGVSGGLLLVGIATGWWNSYRPTVAQVPRACSLGPDGVRAPHLYLRRRLASGRRDRRDVSTSRTRVAACVGRHHRGPALRRIYPWPGRVPPAARSHSSALCAAH